MPLTGTDCDLLFRSWSLGHIDVGTVTDKSCRYVTDYLMDKGKGGNYYGRVPPFQLQSQGLGLNYAWDNYFNIVSDLSVSFRGVKCSIPRFYVKKLCLKDDIDERIRFYAEGTKKNQEIYAQVETIYANVEDERERYYLIKDHLKRMNDQRGLTIAARMRCKKK